MDQNSEYVLPTLRDFFNDDYCGETCRDEFLMDKNRFKALGSERNMKQRLQKSYSARVGMSLFSSSTETRQSSTNTSSTRWLSRIKKISNPFTNLHPWRKPLSKPPSGDFKLSRNLGSPVHLHARLSLEYELDMPVLKFSLDCPEDIYVAKLLTGNDESRFVYMFHYIGGKRNGYVNEQRSKEPAFVGQMQVSNRICVDPKSAVTEFVLCDVSHARRSGPGKEKLTKQKSFRRGWTKTQSKCAENESNPYPSSDLHPGLEIAAIVIQDACMSDEESYEYMKKSRREVKVILPTGNHGLPNTENSCPLRILQRWRSGGGCDCNGWDMGCHLYVLESLRTNFADQPFFELFIEGMMKEKVAAMRMGAIREREYQVEFHAKLTALQAFSICVAWLHRDADITLSSCISLRQLIDMDSPLSLTHFPPSFIPNLTFSPISRV